MIIPMNLLAVTNPNGRVAGDGDHSDIYYNYEYKKTYED